MLIYIQLPLGLTEETKYSYGNDIYFIYKSWEELLFKQTGKYSN